MRYVFKVTLRTVGYDESEQEVFTVHGIRRHVGTEDSAVTFARRTRTAATEALIERVQVEGGPAFRGHEIASFTVGLGD